MTHFTGKASEDLDELEELRPKLMSFFRYNRCVSPQDETQETLSRAIERLRNPSTELYVPLKTYIFGIARNVLHESRRGRESATDPTGPEFAALSSERGLTADEQILVQECLACLAPEEQRQVIDYHLKGAETIAEELGITPNAVRIRIHRLHKKVQELLLEKNAPGESVK